MPDPFASTKPAEIAGFVGKHYIYTTIPAGSTRPTSRMTTT